MAEEKSKLDSNFIPVSLAVNMNGEIRMIKIDSVSDALINIPFDHQEVHEGNSFIICDVQNVSTTTLKWMITTPNSAKYCHAIFDLDCTGELELTVTEGADRNGVNALTPINRNRIGTPTAATLTAHRTTSGGTTDGAVTIEHKRVGSTGVGNKTISGGGSRGQNEYILKPNTKYVISVTTFADVYVSMCLGWYEHQS